MSKINEYTIKKVVNPGTYCSCGLCAGICPTDALEMAIQEKGDLVKQETPRLCRGTSKV